jgi:hypothetical protein
MQIILAVLSLLIYSGHSTCDCPSICSGSDTWYCETGCGNGAMTFGDDGVFQMNNYCACNMFGCNCEACCCPFCSFVGDDHNGRRSLLQDPYLSSTPCADRDYYYSLSVTDQQEHLSNRFCPSGFTALRSDLHKLLHAQAGLDTGLDATCEEFNNAHFKHFVDKFEFANCVPNSYSYSYSHHSHSFSTSFE